MSPHTYGVKNQAGLDLPDEEVSEHFARGDAARVVERPPVERRREHVRQTERQHQRDPAYDGPIT